MTVLVTGRLTLAPHTPGDFADCAAMWADPEVVRHIGGRPFTAEESWARLLRYAGLWSLLGYGYWAVRETATGRFAGDIGFADFHREIEPGFGGAPEAGWALARWAHGQGFAAEALGAALEWADSALDAPRTVCLIDPANIPSLALAAKVGFRPYADATYKGSPTRLFERPRPLRVRTQ